jgi:hypothetical protein
MQELERLDLFRSNEEVLRCAICFDRKEIFTWFLHKRNHCRNALKQIRKTCINQNADEFYIDSITKYLKRS